MKFEKFKQNPILSPLESNEWESLVTCNPGVIYDDGTFYMLYRAAGNDSEHVIRFGLATSKDGHYKIQFDCSGNGTIVESTGGCAYYYPVGSAYIPTFGYSSNPTYESLLTDPGCCNPDGTKIFVELTEEITPDSSIFNFNWAGPNSFTSSMQNPMIINAAITASGIYTVTVTNSNGCSATGDIAVTVNPLPVANAGNDQSVYQGSSVTLTATGGTSYNWNNGVINGVPFYPTITTTYTVSVTDANGCSATDNVVIYVSTLSLLPPPDLRCASVDASGNVTLSWKAVPDPLNNFNSYHIYSSLSFSGPFTIVDSIFNINQTTYTDIGAGANTQSVYYYIKTRSDSVGGSYSEPSDTIRTITFNTC